MLATRRHQLKEDLEYLREVKPYLLKYSLVSNVCVRHLSGIMYNKCCILLEYFEKVETAVNKPENKRTLDDFVLMSDRSFTRYSDAIADLIVTPMIIMMPHIYESKIDCDFKCNICVCSESIY